MGIVASQIQAVVSVSGADKAKSDLEGVGGVVNKMGGVLGGVLVGAAAAAGAAVIGFGIQSVKAAGDYQASLTSLVTGAGETQSNLQMVSDGILKIANQTGTSTQQLTDGMYMIESAGFHGAAGLAVLTASAEASKVGNADLGVVAGAVTTVMHDYASSNISATQAANALITTVASGKTHMQDLSSSLATVLPLASSLHIPFQQVAGAISTMTNAGMPAQQATQNLANAIRSLNVESKPGATALTAIGLSSTELHNTLVNQGLPDALQMIEDHIGKKWPLSSEQGQQALKAIMGGATGLNVALMIGGSHMKEYQSDINAVSASLKSGSNNVQGWSLVQQEFNFKIDRAKEALETLSIRVGTMLLPVVGVAVDFLANLADQAQVAFSIMWNWLEIKVTPVLQQFWTWISKYILPALKDFWTWLGSMVVGALRDFWMWLQINVLPVLQQFWTWLTTKVVPALQDMWRWLETNVVPALKDFWSIIINSVISALQSMWNWIQANVIPALQSMWELINNSVIPALQSLAQWIMDHVVQALQQLWKWITDNVIPAFQQMSDWINNHVVPALQSLEDWINNHALKALRDLAANLNQNGTINIKKNMDLGGMPGMPGLGSGLGAIANPLQNIDIGNTVNTAIKALTQLGQIVQKDVKPYIKDIVSDFDDLKDSLSELAGSISDFFNSFKKGSGNIDWFKTAMNTIKSIIAQLVFSVMAPALVVMSIFADAFYGMSDAIDGVRETIHAFMDTASDFKKALLDMFNGKDPTYELNKMAFDIMNIWTSMINTIEGSAEIMMAPVTGTFRGLTQAITDLFQGLSDTLVGHSIIPDMINSIVAWFAQLPSRILGEIASLASQIAGSFNNLAANAVTWGYDMMSNFSAGIANASGGLIAQAQNVASQIASILHFSKPDIGPLSDADKWMPDMMDLLASGMNQNLGKIKSAALNVATTINPLSSNLQGVPATNLGNNATTQVVVQPAPIYLDGHVLATSLLPYQTNAIRYAVGSHNI